MACASLSALLSISWPVRALRGGGSRAVHAHGGFGLLLFQLHVRQRWLRQLTRISFGTRCLRRCGSSALMFWRSLRQRCSALTAALGRCSSSFTCGSGGHGNSCGSASGRGRCGSCGSASGCGARLCLCSSTSSRLFCGFGAQRVTSGSAASVREVRASAGTRAPDGWREVRASAGTGAPRGQRRARRRPASRLTVAWRSAHFG